MTIPSCLVPDPPWLGQEDGGQEYEHPIEEVAGVVGNGHWIGYWIFNGSHPSGVGVMEGRGGKGRREKERRGEEERRGARSGAQNVQGLVVL